MIAPDANLLLYAIDRRSPRHDAAVSWLERTMSGTETVGLAWSVLVAVIRLSTRAAVFEHPLSTEQALDLVDGWLTRSITTILEPTGRHSALLRELLRPLGSAGNLTGDAHLAALAIQHGAIVHSCDADFSRFSGVRWLDPLA